jgi:CelD/BcsL family acetyltransferase involved in cellulose biosynthesis
LALREVPSESIFLAHLIRFVRQEGKHYVVEEGSFCPGVRLPASFDAYLRELSSHGRHAFRRKMRRLLSHEGVEHEVFRSAEIAERGLPILRDLYTRRWGTDNRAFFEFLSHYLDGTAAGSSAELSVLKVQQRPIAALLHLTRERTMYQYLMAVDKAFNKRISVGSLMCGLNIQLAIDAGYREYDFLKGQEYYKLKFMNCARRSLNLRLYNRTAWSLSAWAGASAKGVGKILFR